MNIATQNIWFHDRYGSPEIFLNINGRFLNKNKQYIGFINGNQIYNIKGDHCGWIENGIIRDLNGYSVSFRRGASDNVAPIFPIPRLEPFIGSIPIPPRKSWLAFPKLKPIKRFGRSLLSPITLFKNGR